MMKYNLEVVQNNVTTTTLRHTMNFQLPFDIWKKEEEKRRVSFFM